MRKLGGPATVTNNTLSREPASRRRGKRTVVTDENDPFEITEG
jgi:hypothetical protein